MMHSRKPVFVDVCSTYKITNTITFMLTVITTCICVTITNTNFDNDVKFVFVYCMYTVFLYCLFYMHDAKKV